jgi:hypothetical protein
MKTEFDIWLLETHRALEKIQGVGQNVIMGTKIFTSPEFSFHRAEEYGGYIFKCSREVSTSEYLTPQQAIAMSQMQAQPGTMITSSGGWSIQPQAMISSHVTKQPIFMIKIHIDWKSKVRSIKWLKKTDRGMSISVTSDYDTWKQEEGYTVHSTMLFLENGNIMVDGVIYSHDNPDAFTTDLVSDNPKIRFLDLLELRAVYTNGLFE